MELTEEIKDLLKAHSMASITDFVNVEDYEDEYLENTDLDISEMKRIAVKYDGWGCDSLEDSIINKLKEQL